MSLQKIVRLRDSGRVQLSPVLAVFLTELQLHRKYGHYLYIFEENVYSGFSKEEHIQIVDGWFLKRKNKH